MLEPVSRHVSQDVFSFHSVFASKFLDSYSVYDWGRMPDSIPLRGKFQTYLQAYLHQKISSSAEWLNFLRSPDALAFRKAGISTSHLNELADLFPMKTSSRGMVNEDNFHSDNMQTMQLTADDVRKGTAIYLLSEAYAEEKVGYVTVLGKTAWDFAAWKNKSGKKALPFEFVCEFGKGANQDFPLVSLRCQQQNFSADLSFTEALLITELSAKKLEEAILRATWIAGFAQFHLKKITANGGAGEKRIIRVRMGMDEVSEYSEFVLLGAMVDFVEVEEQLQKYYSSTIWGKVVTELQQQARMRGNADWKKNCSEPTPWLDPTLKNNFSKQYQLMIAGIATCLSE